MLRRGPGLTRRPEWLLPFFVLGLITPATGGGARLPGLGEPQAPEQARSGDYSFCSMTHSDFGGTMRVSFEGDEPIRSFLLNPHGSFYPASVPLPRKMTVKVVSRDGVSRTFHLDVPSVEKRTDYLTDLYVILQKDGTPTAKLLLEPHPISEMVKLKEHESAFTYTLLPDDADPKYQQYRELCRAAYEGDLQKVKRLLGSGAAVEWADPHWTSALNCARENPKMVDLFLEGARNRLPWGSLARVAARFLLKNDCATADRVVQVLLKARPDREWGPTLMRAAAAAKTDGPIRYVVQRLHLDPNMSFANPGQGAIYFAVMDANLPVLKFLLTEGKADPNIGLPKFSTLDRAEEGEHARQPSAAEIVKLLRDHGARESERGPEWDGRDHSKPVHPRFLSAFVSALQASRDSSTDSNPGLRRTSAPGCSRLNPSGL
jgi:hypothetical protein